MKSGFINYSAIIIYIEEKFSNEEDILRKDSKSMLEELKLMGTGTKQNHNI
jgi:hypothetical protein